MTIYNDSGSWANPSDPITINGFTYYMKYERFYVLESNGQYQLVIAYYR